MKCVELWEPGESSHTYQYICRDCSWKLSLIRDSLSKETAINFSHQGLKFSFANAQYDSI